MPDAYIGILIALLLLVPNKKFWQGLIIGAIFLMKFNAGLILMATLIVIKVFLHLKNIEKIKIKNFLNAAAGFIAINAPFLIIFRNHYSAVYDWLFYFNFQNIPSLARIWPPYLDSLFYPIIIFGLYQIIINIRNKNWPQASVYTLALSLSSMAYPRYDDYHLLPALIIILFLVFQNENFEKLNIKKTGVLKIIVSGLFIFSLLFISAKGFYRLIFHQDKEAYINIASKEDNDFTGQNCSSIYVHPGNEGIYLFFKDIKRGFFSYPDFDWTFDKKMQTMILEDIRQRDIGCFLIENNDKISNFKNDLQEIIKEKKWKEKIFFLIKKNTNYTINII